MPSADKTKIQKERDGTNAKARDYYMKRRREKIGNKKHWQYGFIGTIDRDSLLRCFGISPE